MDRAEGGTQHVIVRLYYAFDLPNGECQVVNANACFSGLRLADYCSESEGETLNVDILVISDYYWTLVTGHTI